MLKITTNLEFNSILVEKTIFFKQKPGRSGIQFHFGRVFIFFSILHFLTTEPNHRTLQTYSRQTHPVNNSTFRGQGVLEHSLFSLHHVRLHLLHQN